MTPEAFAAALDPSAFRSHFHALLAEISDLALRAAEPFTPVLTGALLASERAMVESDTEAVLGADVRYAPFVNAREPFFEAGVEAAEATIAQTGVAFLIDIVESWGAA